MSDWTDGTGYSKDAPRVQKVWSIALDRRRISVIKGHIYHPAERWVVSCSPWWDAKNLDLPEGAPVEDAQRKALKWAKTRIHAEMDAVNAALDRLENPPETTP
jgi:hypothetical protein